MLYQKHNHKQCTECTTPTLSTIHLHFGFKEFLKHPSTGTIAGYTLLHCNLIQQLSCEVHKEKAIKLFSLT